MNRTRSFRLRCESLESRDVPAIVLDGTFNGTSTTPNGGAITVTEIDGTFTAVNGNLMAPQTVTASTTASDTITLRANGATLTVTNSDGIFIRVTNQGGVLVQAGTALDVPNVTRVTVNLQFGGNDVVTDNSMLNATINAGPGNDTIISTGMLANPQAALFIQTPINPALLPLLGTLGGAKVLQGGDGDDSITGPLLGFYNQLDGGNGNDVLVGGIGPDVLTGGGGLDVLTGLGGGDFYVALDVFFDYVLNSRGDTVIADPFDFVQVR
jgi:Ca2+-binding RTX toxin-like protein